MGAGRVGREAARRPSADACRGLPPSPRHQVARRLEGSARGALVAVVVPAESIPNAISVVTVVQMAGEVSSSLTLTLTRTLTLTLP